MSKAQIGLSNGKKLFYELNSLTRHAIVLGTTGSGKTVLAKVILEEAMQRGIPVIAIDPKGDLGSLAIVSENFDFRPFTGTSVGPAEKVANNYFNALKDFGIDKGSVSRLKKVEAKVYTPKSSVGILLSLVPNLSAPKNFNKILESDPNIVADFIEPVSDSVLSLAGMRGNKDKPRSLISSILIHSWEQGKDLNFESLVSQIMQPPFETIGSLPLDDFMKENERRALAASVNLVLSSPGKRAWSHGHKLDLQSMFTQGKLSVFDLRFTGGTEEKQFVVEQLLQETYKFLLKKGGSLKLRYILYIDELLGLLPPPPASPPSKKLLELLIRQARAFGLGIVLATQSPGDIDYRVFGNIGTRFIGKLRTERDIEKVASSTGMSPSKLRTDVTNLKTGEFMYNDSVKNFTKRMNARWLVTYHKGPLKENEIRWVNDSSSMPKVSGKVSLSRKISKEKHSMQGISGKSSAKSLVKALSKQSENNAETYFAQKRINNLSVVVRQAKNCSDKVQLKIALSKSEEYVPHLRVVIEPKQINGLEFQMQGPYIFDMTSQIIPIGNFLKSMSWSTFISDDIKVEKARASARNAVEYSLRDAKDNLKTPFFQSTLLNFRSLDRDEVEKKNHAYLMQAAELRLRQLKIRETRKTGKIESKIRANSSRASKYRLRVGSSKATRMMKRLFIGKKIKSSTVELKYFQKRAEKLKKENKRLNAKISRLKEDFRLAGQVLKDKAFQKAHTCVKTLYYKPGRKDLVIHSTILLVPKRKFEL